MTKEKAIMELMTNAKQIEALEAASRFLRDGQHWEIWQHLSRNEWEKLRMKAIIFTMWQQEGNSTLTKRSKAETGQQSPRHARMATLCLTMASRETKSVIPWETWQRVNLLESS